MIEKVSKWRLYYRGCHINGEFVKLTLEEAAQRVKISKKSLDDYLMQLRSARKFSFDFEKHSQDKVGTIRAFVRKKKEEERLRKTSSGKDGNVSGKTKKDNLPKDDNEKNTASNKMTPRVGKNVLFKPKPSKKIQKGLK